MFAVVPVLVPVPAPDREHAARPGPAPAPTAAEETGESHLSPDIDRIILVMSSVYFSTLNTKYRNTFFVCILTVALEL